MARSAEAHLQSIVGEFVIALASLRAENELLAERLTTAAPVPVHAPAPVMESPANG